MRNGRLTIPYTLNGEERNYIPEFIAVMKQSPTASHRECCGEADEINLLIEVTGEKKKDKAAKVATASTLWVPAINDHGAFGRWTFIEVTDPWDAKNAIRGSLQTWAASRQDATPLSSEAIMQD